MSYHVTLFPAGDLTSVVCFLLSSQIHHKMRASLLRLAESVSSKPLNLREASATLYPPIPWVSCSFQYACSYRCPVCTGDFCAFTAIYRQKCGPLETNTLKRVYCGFCLLIYVVLIVLSRISPTQRSNESGSHHRISLTVEDVSGPNAARYRKTICWEKAWPNFVRESRSCISNKYGVTKILFQDV